MWTWAALNPQMFIVWKKKLLRMSKMQNRHSTWIWVLFPSADLSRIVTCTLVSSNLKIWIPFPSWNSWTHTDELYMALDLFWQTSAPPLIVFLLIATEVRVEREQNQKNMKGQNGFSFMFEFEGHGSTKWTSNVFCSPNSLYQQQGSHSWHHVPPSLVLPH
jgi:hypothetical protein